MLIPLIFEGIWLHVYINQANVCAKQTTNHVHDIVIFTEKFLFVLFSIGIYITNWYLLYSIYLQQQSARFLGPPRERSSPTLPSSLTGQCSAGNNNHPIHRPCSSCPTDLCEHHTNKSFGPSPIFNESCRR